MNSGTCWDHRRIATKVAIGVVGAFVAMGVAACSGGSNNPSVAPTTTAPPSATAPAKAGHAHRLIGQIAAENGSTWTVNATCVPVEWSRWRGPSGFCWSVSFQ